MTPVASQIDKVTHVAWFVRVCIFFFQFLTIIGVLSTLLFIFDLALSVQSFVVIGVRTVISFFCTREEVGTGAAQTQP